MHACMLLNFQVPKVWYSKTEAYITKQITCCHMLGKLMKTDSLFARLPKNTGIRSNFATAETSLCLRF